MRYNYLQKVNIGNSTNLTTHQTPHVARRTACEGGVLLPGNPEVQSRSDVTHKCLDKLAAYTNHS
jgi:hypothetical protein